MAIATLHKSINWYLLAGGQPRILLLFRHTSVVGSDYIHFNEWGDFEVVWIIRQEVFFIGVQQQGVDVVVSADPQIIAFLREIKIKGIHGAKSVFVDVEVGDLVIPLLENEDVPSHTSFQNIITFRAVEIVVIFPALDENVSTVF